MLTLPEEFSKQISAFAPVFLTKKVFEHAKVLFLGALLCIGRRTVCSCLRSVGLQDEKRFHKYHWVLSLAEWSPRRAAGILLRMLVNCLCPDGPLTFAIDETVERRWGKRIEARGIYRDGVRSSKSHFTKTSGLRWVSLMLLAPISWAERVWALPFLTVLAPSVRYYQERHRKHRPVLEWARLIVLQLRRWLPNRQLIIAGDGAYASLTFLDAVRPHVAFITRLRLDAALYEPAPERERGQNGRPRLKGARLPNLEDLLQESDHTWQRISIPCWYGRPNRPMLIRSGTAVWYSSGLPPVPLRWVLLKDPLGKLNATALCCTDEQMSAPEIINAFIRRWTVEVTFQEARAHLGLETQRQWSDKAIERTTPALLGMFSLVTLRANQLQRRGLLPPSTTAWYRKLKPTFSDAMAAVRRDCYLSGGFYGSTQNSDIQKPPGYLLDLFWSLLARAG